MKLAMGISQLCPLSTMKDLYTLIGEADRVVTFFGALTFLSGVIVAFRMSETVAKRKTTGGNG